MGPLLDSVTDYLVRQSWQIPAVFVLVAAACWGVRKASAHWRYLLWLVVLAKCLVPGLISVPLAVMPQKTELPPASIAVPSPVAAVEAKNERAIEHAAPVDKPVSSMPQDAAAPFGRHTVPRVDLSLRSWLTIVWLPGAGLFLVYASIRAWTTHRRLKQSRRRADREIRTMVAELTERLGLKKAPAVYIVDAVAQPFVWGWLRGSIYLPKQFITTGTREQREAILTHELAHVARWDAAANLVQILAQAMFFFHPMVWWTNRQIRREREKCCDEIVIASLGIAPKQYGEAIVNALVAEYETSQAFASLAVAGRLKHIEERIQTILCPNRRFYHRPSWPAVTTAMLLAACAVPTALILTARGGTAEPPSTRASQTAAQPAVGAAAEAKVKRPSTEADARPVRGKVIDENGKPVAGADVWLPVYTRERHVLHTKADSQGRFALEVPSAWLAEAQPWNQATSLWAHAEGRQLGTAKALLSQEVVDALIQLGPATDTAFVVLTPEGRPCVGALVAPYYVKAGLGYEPLPEELAARVGARTDAEGRVRLPAVSRDVLFQVRVSTREFGIQLQRTDKSEPLAIVGQAIRLRPVCKVEGRVIADQPEMTRGLRLVLTTEEHPSHAPPWPTEGFADVESDKQGRFVVPAMAVGRLRIDAGVDESQPLRPRLPEFVDVEPTAETTLISIWMVPTVIVRGTIRAKDTKKPIPGAYIHIYYGVGRQGATPVSDAEGRYTARVLPGRVALQVINMAEKYVQLGDPWNHPYEVPHDAKEFDLPPLEVEPAKSTAGRVIDRRGQPVANAWIHIVEGHRRYGIGKSDSNGQFTLIHLPATLDIAKAKYVVVPEVSPSIQHECEVIKITPLTLRMLPRDPR